MNRSLLCDLCIAILAQILRTAVAHENEDLLAPSRQDAKFGTFFFTFAPLRLCARYSNFRLRLRRARFFAVKFFVLSILRALYTISPRFGSTGRPPDVITIMHFVQGRIKNKTNSIAIISSVNKTHKTIA